ncbi:craniofacial development protein 2-like [Rhopilema esculentum]|uniref:craniofacial development protein 2-like n=1 Tax=Rhopilema esculentum TaxID=499914 RepID=UPI0031D268A2
MPVSSKIARVPGDVPLRSDGTQLATEEGCSSGLSNSSNNEAVVLNPLGRMIADTAEDEKPQQFHNNKNHTIATWNVRTMNQGKLEVVTNEMDRINLDILGISEMKWTGCGDFRYDDHTVYYSGHQQYKRN